MTDEWWEPWCRTVNEGNIRQGKVLDSRLQTSGMTEGGFWWLTVGTLSSVDSKRLKNTREASRCCR